MLIDVTRSGNYDYRFEAKREDYQEAHTCPRKLSLILKGMKSDVEGGRVYERREEPSLLGQEGEGAVGVAITGGTPIRVQLDTIPELEVSAPAIERITAEIGPEQWEKILERLKIIREADLGMAFSEEIIRNAPKIAEKLDGYLPELPDLQPVIIEPTPIPEYLQELIDKYKMRDILREVSFQSDGLLVRGRLDYIALTDDNQAILLEVKNSKSRSWTNDFQIAMYLNAIRSGAQIRGGGLAEHKAEMSIHERNIKALREYTRTIHYIYSEYVPLEILNLLTPFLLKHGPPGVLDGVDTIVWETEFWRSVLNLSLWDLERTILEKSKRYQQATSSDHKILQKTKKIQTKISEAQKRVASHWNSIDTGILIYHRHEELRDITKDTYPFQEIASTRWGIASLVTRGTFHEIPEDPPCSRCKYKKACEKAKRGTVPERDSTPLPILYETVDDALPTAEILTNSEKRLIMESVPELQEPLREVVNSESPILDMLQPIRKWRQQMEFDQITSLFSHRAEISSIMTDILSKKTQMTIEEDKKLGERIRYWGEKQPVRFVPAYVQRVYGNPLKRPSLSENLKSYWKI